MILVDSRGWLELLAWSGEAASAAGVAVMSQATVVPLDAALALEAARLGPATALPSADSIIYATALHHSAELWTHDEHVRGLPGVRLIEPPTPEA